MFIPANPFPKDSFPQGWQCPVCGRVMSGAIAFCVYCYNNPSPRNGGQSNPQPFGVEYKKNTGATTFRFDDTTSLCGNSFTHGSQTFDGINATGTIPDQDNITLTSRKEGGVSH